MTAFKDAFRAAALSAPLVFASPTALANPPSPEIVRTVESVQVRVGKTVSDKGPDVSNAISSDLVEEVRLHLHIERCYALYNKSNNAAEWLSAIGELDRVNDETAGKYDKKSQAAFERAKERLQKARSKAGVPFYRIMDGNRDIKEGEKSCLVRKTGVKM